MLLSLPLAACRRGDDSTPVSTYVPATEVATQTSACSHTHPHVLSHGYSDHQRLPCSHPHRTSCPPSFGLRLPEGFQVQVYTSRVPRPTSLAFAPDGTLYVSSETGLVMKLADTDSDGKADSVDPLSQRFVLPLGLAFYDGALYVSSRGRVHTLRDTDGDDEFDEVEEIISGLPVVGGHQNNGLAFGPDSKLYMNLGSTCNACIEADERNATIMRFNADGTDGTVYASGLRNVYDLAFHPEDDTLWAADNGRDDRPNLVPEELNLIVEGGDYGWPSCWGDGGGTGCEGTLPPIAEMEAHGSANGLAFYTGDMFPDEYRNNIFIALWGSLSGAHGRKVMRIELTKRDDTYDAQVSEFILGLDRPLDVVVAPDGALLIADHLANAVYRVFYTGPNEGE